MAFESYKIKDPRNGIYDIDKEFEYIIIKNIVLNSLKKIAKEEALMKASSSYDYNGIDDNSNNVIYGPKPLLKLKIRNTTRYLNWRLAFLKRDNFTCRICHARVKGNSSLRLEIYHAKAFKDICNESNVSCYHHNEGITWNLRLTYALFYLKRRSVLMLHQL